MTEQDSDNINHITLCINLPGRRRVSVKLNQYRDSTQGQIMLNSAMAPSTNLSCESLSSHNNNVYSAYNESQHGPVCLILSYNISLNVIHDLQVFVVVVFFFLLTVLIPFREIWSFSVHRRSNL